LIVNQSSIEKEINALPGWNGYISSSSTIFS